MAKWQGATATRGEVGWAGGMQFYTGGFSGDNFSDVKDGAVRGAVSGGTGTRHPVSGMGEGLK
jgi:hypothetical protein